MTEEVFLLEEERLLDEIRNSSLYLKMKELSSEIDLSEEINDLAKKRDEYFSMSAYAVSDEEKEKLIQKGREYDLHILEQPLVKEYLSYYHRVRDLLNQISGMFSKGVVKV